MCLLEQFFRSHSKLCHLGHLDISSYIEFSYMKKGSMEARLRKVYQKVENYSIVLKAWHDYNHTTT